MHYFLLFVPIVYSFTPLWLGEPFRERSIQSFSENQKLSQICGYQRKSKEKLFPWAVSFTVDGINHLGGSIISPYHILTVAHGFITTISSGSNLCGKMGANESAYRDINTLQTTRKIAYGGKCIRGFSATLPNHAKCHQPDVRFNKIRSVLIDAEFVNNNCMRGHDFAIVELENRIHFDENVVPICLPTTTSYYPRIVTIPGWGRQYIFNESGPMIHEIQMEIDLKCKRPWSDRLPNDASDHICAKSLDPLNYYSPRTCHGDSGGGMEFRDDNNRAHLISMTSFGTKGCPPNMLARFTKIVKYLPEICKYTGVCYSMDD